MKAILFDDFGGADVLHLGDAPRPEIRPDDLLVKVMAAGVNRADILQREGVYGTRCYGDSTLLGLEIAGEVLAIGSAVQGFVCEELATRQAQDISRFGGWRHYMAAAGA